MISSFDTEIATAEHDAQPFFDAVIDFLTTQDGATTPFRFRTKDEVGLLAVGRHIYTPPVSPNQWIVLGLWDESSTPHIPIGISERRLYPQQRLADGPHGMVANDDDEDNVVVLPPALVSITQIADPMASFVIRPNYQRKGYGNLLWTLTLATLNRLGIDTVKVMSDITSMDGKPSFYTRLTPNSTRNEHGSLMIPTTMTPLQQNVLNQIHPPSLV